MDAITLLRDDHKTVERLFKRFEKAGDRAHVEKREIVDRIIEELSVHAAIEEQVFYPVARATVPGTEDIALESLEEHHIVKWVLSELDGLDPADERFDAKVTVLIENVRHHVEEEESDFFPKVRSELGRKALDRARRGAGRGQEVSADPSAPALARRPSWRGRGTIAGVVDRVGDNISGVAQGSVSALQDLIARIRGTAKPKVSPTGSTTTRKRAKGVRRAASTAIDGTQETVRSARKGAKKTTQAAASGVKSTATTAKKSARATGATGKRAASKTASAAKRAS